MGDWVRDIAHMQKTFGIQQRIDEMDDETLKKYLEFRMKFLREEFEELEKAYQNADAEGIVDSLIDFCVVAIGTLEGFKVDTQLAWDRVHSANMAKQPGVKPNRPNPLGLPDLLKPEGWVGPCHGDNLGTLPSIGYF